MVNVQASCVIITEESRDLCSIKQLQVFRIILVSSFVNGKVEQLIKRLIDLVKNGLVL